MKHDILSDVLSTIKTGDSLGKREVMVPFSNLARDVLKVLQACNYISEFEYIDDKKGGKMKVQLIGVINNCKAVRPRFDITKGEYEKYKRRFLPAAGFGILIITTSQGILSHNDAVSKGIGGKIIAFIY